MKLLYVAALLFLSHQHHLYAKELHSDLNFLIFPLPEEGVLSTPMTPPPEVGVLSTPMTPPQLGIGSIWKAANWNNTSSGFLLFPGHRSVVKSSGGRHVWMGNHLVIFQQTMLPFLEIVRFVTMVTVNHQSAVGSNHLSSNHQLTHPGRNPGFNRWGLQRGSRVPLSLSLNGCTDTKKPIHHHCLHQM